MKKADCILKLLKFVILCAIIIAPDIIYSQGLQRSHVAEKHIYKTRGLHRLKLYVFQPSRTESGKKLPAIIFFHGGGLSERLTWEFEPQSKYLVERGMVAILAGYTVKRSGRTQFESIADAKSAIRWVRAHADELGIDENHIAAGGGSAGAYLAVCAALIKNLDEKNEELSISSIPNALVLFNPRLILPATGDPPLSKKDMRYLNGRILEEISPFHNIHDGVPPIIIFQGTADMVFSTQKPLQFCEEMKKHGNICEVILYDGREHGFFHYFHGDNPDFLSTMKTTVQFLSKLGYMSPDKQ